MTVTVARTTWPVVAQGRNEHVRHSTVLPSSAMYGKGESYVRG